MKDRFNLEHTVKVLNNLRNTLATDPKWKENVEEIDEVINGLLSHLIEQRADQKTQRDKDLREIVQLAIAIIKTFFF